MTRKFSINLKKLNRVMYVIAAVFLLSSLLLSAVNLPAYAYNNSSHSEEGDIDGGNVGGEKEAGEGSGADTGDTVDEGSDENADEEAGEESEEGAGEASGEGSDDASDEGSDGTSEENAGESADEESDEGLGDESGTGDDADPAAQDEGQPTLTPTPTLSPTPEVELLAQNQRQGNITGSSLSAIGGCSANCQTVSATFKNTGDGDMQQASSWELYYSPDGFNTATKVDGVGGSFGPLDAGEQETITTAAVNGSGQYWIIVKQEAGHPGSGEVRSDGCLVVCTEPTPTPPPQVFDVSFLQGTSQGLCKVETGTATATVKVDLPDGVSGSLVTTWQVVSPSGSNPGGPGEMHSQTVAVGDGDEVAVNAAWPGIPLGATEPIEVAFTAVLMVEGVQKANANFSYYWNAEVCPPPPVTGSVDLSLVCGFPGSDYTFRVQNNMNVPKTYQLAVQGEADLFSGTLAPGEAAIHSVVRGGEKQATLYVDGSPVASATADEENSVCLENLVLSYVCTDGGILYSVTNPNNFGIEFSTMLDGNSAGTGSVDANTTTSFLFSDSGQHSVSVIWSNGLFANNSSGILTDPDTCQDPGEFLPLQLSYACSGEGLEWTVTNPNGFAVEFDWSVLDDQVVSVSKVGSGLAAPVAAPSGTEVVEANSNLMFYFSGQEAVDVEIRFMTNEEEEVVVVESSEEDVCSEPPSEPPTDPPPNNPPPNNPPPTNPPPPAPPEPPQVFVPQPEIAAAPEVLIPVTGLDLSNLNGFGLLRELAFNIGAVVLGLALVLEAFRKGFGM